jgi:hypothetical protein
MAKRENHFMVDIISSLILELDALDLAGLSQDLSRSHSGTRHRALFSSRNRKKTLKISGRGGNWAVGSDGMLGPL